MKRWHIISVLLFSYFFFLSANIPASRVLNNLQQKGNLPAIFYGVQGTVWQGHADSVLIPGQPKLENLDWSVNPFALLLARLSAGIETEIHKQHVSGHISWHYFGGDLYISDTEARLPAKTLQQIIELPLGELGGEFEFYIDSIHWQPETTPQIEAEIFWQHAKLALTQTVDLGQVNISISTDDAGQTRIAFTNSGGELNMNGEASTGTDRNYILNITLKPKDPTGETAQSLNLFAQRQADGSYVFKHNGNLGQLGF